MEHPIPSSSTREEEAMESKTNKNEKLNPKQLPKLILKEKERRERESENRRIYI